MAHRYAAAPGGDPNPWRQLPPSGRAKRRRGGAHHQTQETKKNKQHHGRPRAVFPLLRWPAKAAKPTQKPAEGGGGGVDALLAGMAFLDLGPPAVREHGRRPRERSARIHCCDKE